MLESSAVRDLLGEQNVHVTESGPFKTADNAANAANASMINHVRSRLVPPILTHGKPGGTVTELHWSVIQDRVQDPISRPNIKEKSGLASKTSYHICVVYQTSISTSCTLDSCTFHLHLLTDDWQVAIGLTT